MGSKTAMRRDENLLKKARAVFGDDLISDAFVCIIDYGGTAEEINRNLSAEMHKEDSLDERGLSYNASEIRLVFCNGNVVSFENSEWATMRNPTDESYCA